MDDTLDFIKQALFKQKFSFSEDNQITYPNYNFSSLSNIRVGTIFSGIGAFEHALSILKVPHTISFACDNGGNLLEDIITPLEFKEFSELSSSEQKLSFIENIYSKSKRTNFVKQSYLANYPIKAKDFYHDVRFIGSFINKPIDILVGGSPCQSFSTAGNRGGFEDTRGTLFFEYARCVKEFKPKVFIYENVKGLTNHDKGKTFYIVLNTFNELGYHYYYKILNSKDFGIPQNRQRIFIVGFKKPTTFEFPKEIPLNLTMGDFLIGKVDSKYILSEKQRAFVSQEKQLSKKYTQINGTIGLCQKSCQQYNLHGDFVEDKYYLSEKVLKYVLATSHKNASFNPTINTDYAKTLLASMHKMHRASMDNYVSVDGKIRRLTPRECLRLMGFLDSFKQVVSDLQMYKQAGNSIVVDVLIHLFLQILKTKTFS